MFKLGDTVKFELTPSIPKNSPRWNMNADTGCTGHWAHGEVVSVTDFLITVKYTIDGYLGDGETTFPNRYHDDFLETQWGYDGYLQTTKKRGPICECGGTSANTTHSRWCPAHKA